MIVGGIYLFFLLEYVMKMIVRFKEKSPSDNKQEQVCHFKDLFACMCECYAVKQSLNLTYRIKIGTRLFSILKSGFGFLKPDFGSEKRILLHRNLSARWTSLMKSRLGFYGFANFVFVLEIRKRISKTFFVNSGLLVFLFYLSIILQIQSNRILCLLTWI